MLFVQGGGKIGIGFGFDQNSAGIELENYNYFLLDYYVCFNKRSEFNYIARSNIEAISLSKSFLHDNIFSKYPRMAYELKVSAERRYINNISRVLHKQREQHIQKINSQSTYKNI